MPKPAQLLGMADGEWIPRPVEDVLWGLFPGTAEPQTMLTGTRHGSPFHATLPAPNGRLVSVEGTYSISNPQLREAMIVAHPSEKERAPKSRLMEDVLSSLPEAVAIEHQNHILYTNPAFTRMFGYTAEEVSGGSLRELIVPETRLNENATLLRLVDERGSATVETVRINKAGELVDVSMQIAPLLVDGAKVGYVFTFRDIGEYKQTEAKLQHDAMHDVLTGLPNRALFLDRLNLTLTPPPAPSRPWLRRALFGSRPLQGRQRQRWATPRAMFCWWRLPGGCVPRCALRTRPRGWAATSLPCWWRTL